MKAVTRTVLILACLQMLIPLISPAVLADEDTADASIGLINDSGQNVKLFADDRVVTGVNNRIDAYFEIGKNKRTVSGSYVEIDYSHSPVITAELSHMTILIDDLPLHSVQLDETNLDRTRLHLDLSNITLEPGFHKLSFLIDMNAAEMVCANPDSPANWLVIYKASHIHLVLEDISKTIDLSLYPVPFYEIGNRAMQHTVFVVPDDPVHEELHAAATLSQFFARQNSSERIPFSVYTESELTPELAASKHVIWIGLTDRWQGMGRTAMAHFLQENDVEASAKHWIGLLRSPWNEARTQLIVTGNAEALANGAKILSHASLYSQLRGTHSFVTTQPLSQGAVAGVQSGREVRVTFAQMGYGNMVMENTIAGHTSVYYHLPGNWDFADGVKLQLHYTHSKSMNLYESVIAVKVGGITMGSRYLSDSMSGKGVIDIELPQENIGNRRTLDIEVYVDFIRQGKVNNVLDECSDISLIGNWLVIDPASSITFTPLERQQFDLQSTPFPFVVQGQWHDTLVILPDSVNKDLLSTLMTWVGFMGKDTVHNSRLQFAKLQDVDIDASLRQQNVIFIGAAAQLPALLKDTEQSAIRFTAGGQVQSSRAQVEILGELQQKSAVAHLSRSPYAEDLAVLQLVVTPGGQADMLTRALVDPLENVKLNGPFAIVDERYVVHAFAAESLSRLPEVISEDDTGRFSLLMLVFMSLLLFVLLWLMLFLWRMMRR